MGSITSWSRVWGWRAGHAAAVLHDLDIFQISHWRPALLLAFFSRADEQRTVTAWKVCDPPPAAACTAAMNPKEIKMLILCQCHPSYPSASTQSPQIAALWDWQYISGPVLSHQHPIMPSGVLGTECLNLSPKVLKDKSDETLLLHYTDPFVLHWFKNYLSNLHSAVTLQYIDPAPVRHSPIQPCQPPLEASLVHSKFLSFLSRLFTSFLLAQPSSGFF